MSLEAVLEPAGADARASALPCQIQNNLPRPPKGLSGGLRRPLKVELSDGPQGEATQLWTAKPSEGAELTPEELSYARAGATKSVWACLHGGWSLICVAKATGKSRTFRFRCKSWRCPRCRFDVARSDFARLVEGFKAVVDDGREWVLLTLTFDPSKFTGTLAEKATKAYLSTCSYWNRFKKQLARAYRWLDGSLPRIDYVQVWEKHKGGMPHVHVALTCPGLAYDIRARGLCDPTRHFGPPDAEGKRKGVRPYRFKRHRERGDWLKLENWAWGYEKLRPMLKASGFGEVCDVQLTWRGAKGLANYFAKLSAQLCGMSEQRPVNAPPHFRRLRASRGVLPSRLLSKGENEGLLVHGDPTNVEDYVQVLEAAGVAQRGLLCIDTTVLQRVVCLTQRSLASAADDLFRSEVSRLTNCTARAGPEFEQQINPAGQRRTALTALRRRAREAQEYLANLIGPVLPTWVQA